MDFQTLFNNLCMNVTLCQLGIITREEKYRYIAGVFSTLNALGLKEAYNTWCEENGILVLENEEE